MTPFSEDSFEEIEDQLDFLMANMTSPRCPLHDAGRFYDEYLFGLRAHAILYLLIDADGENFHHDLNIAGYVRRHLLRRCARYKHSDSYMRSSRMEGFLDSVAAGNLDLATEIAALSSSDWGKEDEYEDDFCYARFQHLYLTRGNKAGPELDGLLQRFEKVLDGATSARLDLCKAFRQGNGSLFADAFASRLSEREKELKAEASQAEEFVVAALNSQVFVEGLALLRIAERAGFSTEAEYESCPTLARLPPKAPPPADPFTPP
jgi:hypothetical protein